MPWLNNFEIASTFYRYADLMELADESAFRARAFRRAAERIKTLSEPVHMLLREGQLRQVEGVGAGIAAAIAELLETGTFAALRDIEQQVPSTLPELMRVPGIGAKTAGRLYRELGITDLAGLEAAAVTGQLRNLSGFGASTEMRVLDGISALRRRTGRARLGTVLPLARRLAHVIDGLAPLVAQVEIAGSVRRMQETVGDIDIVVAATDVEQALLAIDAEVDGTLRDRTSNFLRLVLDSGIQADIFVTRPEEFGSSLVRATGSSEHLMALGSRIPESPTELDVYEKLGLHWIPPELRQGLDEIEQARVGRFANLVEITDIHGEFHSHTTWSDGAASIEEMAGAARDRGYEFLGISDHTQGLGIANGLDAKRLEQQRVEIITVTRETGFCLLTSAEVEVARDGRLDFDDATLATLDIVIASTHVGLQQPREQLTNRLLSVIENPHVDIIAHPSGRLIEQREGGDFDWQQIFEAAARTGTALEINADPARLDLSSDLARRALDAGCLLTVNCDAHHPEAFGLLEYGIGTARRAGARSDQIINCWTLDRIEIWLRQRSTSLP